MSVALLTPGQRWATGAHLARIQRPDGMIPWFRGGHCDPWNHIEAAMALTLAGFDEEAKAAYRWLARTQHADGSWFQYYLPGLPPSGTRPEGIEDDKRDTNVIAYVATGALHHLRATGDRAFARGLWPVVEKAIDFVLSVQRPGGELAWAVEPDGTVFDYGLLTGSSSAYHSIRCAVALAEELDHERPDWELAAGRIATALAFRQELFQAKDPWAMDWYYPVLCGAVGGNAGRERLAAGWDRFVREGDGVRCVTPGEWCTGAETAECAIAHAVVGENDKAEALLAWAGKLRQHDGGYLTGTVHPQGRSFPFRERSTYTSAAVLLAEDCLHGTGGASGIFRGEGLPAGLDLDLTALELDLDLD